MAPHRSFKYDVTQLLAAIRDRPVLWDKTLEIYKDKVERKNAWDEICSLLEEKYEHMTWEEKRTTGDHIINKWTNIRDTFVKSLKGKPNKKRYFFYDHLKFLTKIIPEEELNITEDYNSSEDPSVYMKQDIEIEIDQGTSSSFNSSSRKMKRSDSEEYIPKRSKRVKSSKHQDTSQDSDYETYDPGNIDFVEVDAKAESDPRVMNEDEAFFASLLPTVVRYNEEERLEFRIEVLSVMKKIVSKRKW